MKNEFEVAFNEISELRALPEEIVLEALQSALVSAYRRDSNASAAQRVEATIDPSTGRARIFVEKEVVDDIFNSKTEVDLVKARYYHPEAEIGDVVMVQVEGTTKKFGRIAAQTAKQVILQKIREAERAALYDEYIEKEGDIINGQVQSANSSVVTLSLGRAEAILPRAQQIPGERYRPHDKVRCYVLEVKPTNRGPQIVVSRSHRNMLRRLLEFEVPEIYNGQIEIKNIAREAGHRSKVAVAALQDGIDPVGACVGMRGIRIQNIVKELHDEKIDVIEWNPKQEAFIEKALSPARVTGVYLDDDPDEGRTAVVIVPDDHLSLAIGREGQNARLAAKLTGWRIDIKSVTEAVVEAMDHIDEPPLDELAVTHTELLQEVSTIVEKKNAGRAIMPEDYRVLAQFSDVAERRWQDVREEARQARLAEINAVKATLPESAFKIDVADLDLPDEMIDVLMPLATVGEIMVRFLIDEDRLRKMMGHSEKALMQLQEALDKAMMTDMDALDVDEAEGEEDIEVAAEAELDVVEDIIEEEEAEDVVETTEAVAEEIEAETEIEVEDEPAIEISDEPIEAFPDVILPEDEDEEAVARRAAIRRQQKYAEQNEQSEYVEDEDDEFFDGDSKKKGKSKKEKQKRRQLVYDEESGQTFAKRRRKGGRKREEWDDFNF